MLELASYIKTNFIKLIFFKEIRITLSDFMTYTP